MGARFTGGLTIVLWVFASTSALGQSHEDTPFYGKPLFDDPDDIEDPAPWKERAANLPPYPEDGDLIEIEIPSRSDSFEAFIDGENLQIGEDGVVRYTVVLRSRRGTENVMVEGIRCSTREYRSYAVGVSDGKLEPTPERPWRLIGRPTGAMSYRLAMSETYACQYNRLPFPKETIVKRFAGEQGGLTGFLDDRTY